MKSKRRERFEKVGSNRVQKIINYVDLLSNCSNRNNYEYEEKDVELMFREIHKHLKEARLLFDKEIKKNNKVHFKF